MRKLTKKLSAITLCTLFASMQIASADGLADATINSMSSGTVSTGANSMTLGFDRNAHVNWGKLNVGSNEQLNFNAVNGASGLTILNTVTGGTASVINGRITSNEGISRLIISNPNGMIYNGATVTTAGDLMLTTQPLTAQFNGTDMTVSALNQAATAGVTIENNSNFNVGGKFNIVAPDINAVNSVVKTKDGFKLVTRDGENYLVSQVNNNLNKGVRLKSMSVDGDVYIVAGKDSTQINNGGTIKGNLNIDSNGEVLVNNFTDNQALTVKGDLTATTDGSIRRIDTNGIVGGNGLVVNKTNVEGNANLTSKSGYIRVRDSHVNGDANITTTNEVASGKYRHYVQFVGDNQVDGNLNVDSYHNIHIGNYDSGLNEFLPGSLTVGKDLKANSHQGSVAVTVDTSAKNIDLRSGTKNIVTDGKAKLTADSYKFTANYYIGGLTDKNLLMNTVMENYTPLPVDTYLTVNGGNVDKILTSNNGGARIESVGDMTVDNVNSPDVRLSAVDPSDPLGGTITIKDNVHSDLITIDGKTKLLDLNGNYPAGSRDYTFKFTNILNTEETTVDPNTTITYDMTDGNAPGWNNNTQTPANTRIKAPNAPQPVPPTPVPPQPTPTPEDNDNVKVLNNLTRDQLASAIDMGQAYTPIAYAADLDDEIDTGVRKNVDGSVTVVRPYIPTKK